MALDRRGFSPNHPVIAQTASDFNKTRRKTDFTITFSLDNAEGLSKKAVIAKFDQDHASSDGGAILLKTCDARTLSPPTNLDYIPD